MCWVWGKAVWISVDALKTFGYNHNAVLEAPSPVLDSCICISKLGGVIRMVPDENGRTKTVISIQASDEFI
jgi:hypothetical protein